MENFTLLSVENIAEFVPLYCSVFNSPPWNDGWSEAAVAERLTSFTQSPTFQGMGLSLQGEAVGLVLGWGERWVQGWVFQVKEMCIHVRCQREGFGARLMHAFELHLRELGFTSTNLQTGESAPARVFYEGLGYKTADLVSLHKKLS